MSRLPKYTLEHDESRRRWTLGNDQTSRTVRSFKSKTRCDTKVDKDPHRGLIFVVRERAMTKRVAASACALLGTVVLVHAAATEKLMGPDLEVKPAAGEIGGAQAGEYVFASSKQVERDSITFRYRLANGTDKTVKMEYKSA